MSICTDYALLSRTASNNARRRAQEQIVISLSCLCELVWALRGIKQAKKDVAYTLHTLLDTKNIIMNRPVARYGFAKTDVCDPRQTSSYPFSTTQAEPPPVAITTEGIYHPVALIPVYNNHAQTLPAVVVAVRKAGLDCLLVDDGSEPTCAAVIDRLSKAPGTHLLRLARNSGKGAAIMAGFRGAQAMGYTHALQIDADGQHDLSMIPQFIAASREHPEALICGHPNYDASVPKLRMYARYLTHLWVWINTLSCSIPDSMCGFRLYPLKQSVSLIDAEKPGKRMEFDIEILVHMSWRNQPMRWFPVNVHYPQDGRSYFRPWRDNLLISWMHTRLFFGMLLRLPVILKRRWRA